MILMAFATVAFGLVCIVRFGIDLVEDARAVADGPGNITIATPGDIVLDAIALFGAVASLTTGLWVVSQAPW